MKLSLKLRKFFAAVTDVFVFSVLVRVVLFGLYQGGMSYQAALLISLVIGGLIDYVGIPLLLGKQTLGMKMNRLIFVFVNTNMIGEGTILVLRFFSQLLLNIIFLGTPLAVNLFLLIWKKDSPTISDYLFSRVMVKQAIG